jgi:hypothetical protein
MSNDAGLVHVAQPMTSVVSRSTRQDAVVPGSWVKEIAGDVSLSTGGGPAVIVGATGSARSRL